MTDPRIARYQEAGARGARFTLGFQQPDGGYLWEGYPPDAFHKQSYSWAIAGEIEGAQRLLSWVKAQRLLPDGQLRDYHGDIYKHAWLFQGAHRLGRFDLTYPMARFLLSCQAPCGGFPHLAGEPYCRALAGCQAGIGLLYIGELDAAKRAGEWTIGLLEQPDPGRFYYRTTLDGKLVTPDLDAAGALFIDTTQPAQVYWEIGLPLMLMCRLHQATGEGRYLDCAQSFFEWNLRCHEDGFTFTGSGKSALGAALYYWLTGDRRAREAALRFADFLLAMQQPDGAWRCPNFPPEVLYAIDASAEFNVWLQEIAAILPSGEVRWAG